MSPIASMRWLLAGLIVLMLSGCNPRDNAEIRIGVVPWPGYEYLYLAQEKGYFQALGVNVKLVELLALADSRRAFERGQINGIACTLIEVLQIHDNSSRRPKIVSALDTSEGADVILAQPAIRSLNDLKGKRVGVELGTLGVYLLARALESVGLHLSDVTLVSSNQVSMEEMFKKGEIDAIVSYPPTSIHLQAAQQARQLFSSADIPGEIIDVLAFDANYLAAHRVAVTAILQAHQQALDFAHAHPDDANALMGKHQNISAADFKAGLDAGVHMLGLQQQAAYLKPSGKLEDILQFTGRMLRETAQLKSDPRAEEVIDGSLAATLAR